MKKIGRIAAIAILIVLCAGCDWLPWSAGSTGNETEVPVQAESDAGAAEPSGETDAGESEPAGETATGAADPSASGGGNEAELPEVKLEPLIGEGVFESPVGIEVAPGNPEVIYVIDQPGTISAVDPADPGKEPVLLLDIRDRVHDEGMEQGLLGLAFHPRFATNGYFYVNYTTATHTVIARYEADPAAGKADPASERVLLTFEQPYSNHNGGQLAFGPDGYLYIATGDGGSGGDPHGNGQNVNALLGKILRIDVDRTDGNKAYAIPGDNPFASGGGAPEIYAYGLRNPWRFSFDAATGRLWAADVGQNEIEEIDRIEKGGNYGWNVKEGTACFEPAEGCESDGLIDPVWEYGRDEGISVTGGYVYRGGQLAGLEGWYVYGDYGSGKIWALRQREDGSADNRLLLESGLNVMSFGIDAKGELYVCSPRGIWRLLAA